MGRGWGSGSITNPQQATHSVSMDKGETHRLVHACVCSSDTAGVGHSVKPPPPPPPWPSTLLLKPCWAPQPICQICGQWVRACWSAVQCPTSLSMPARPRARVRLTSPPPNTARMASVSSGGQVPRFTPGDGWQQHSKTTRWLIIAAASTKGPTWGCVCVTAQVPVPFHSNALGWPALSTLALPPTHLVGSRAAAPWPQISWCWGIGARALPPPARLRCGRGPQGRARGHPCHPPPLDGGCHSSQSQGLAACRST